MVWEQAFTFLFFFLIFIVIQLQLYAFFFFNCYSITVVCLFSPSLHPTPGEPTSLSHLHPPPWFCPCVLSTSSCNPLYPLSPPPPPTPALAIVRLFLTSMSLVIFCLLFSSIDYGNTNFQLQLNQMLFFFPTFFISGPVL